MSYNPALASTLDWVRLLIGDTDTADEQLSDAEIEAVIAHSISLYGDGPWTKFLSASDVLNALVIRWRAKGKGVVEKSVSKLRIRRAEQSDATIDGLVKSLRERGAELLAPPPSFFRMV